MGETHQDQIELSEMMWKIPINSLSIKIFTKEHFCHPDHTIRLFMF